MTMRKLKWGIVGGGGGSQIGFAHRAGAELDRRFEFCAGAMDVEPGKAREFALGLGLSPDRAYESWQQMLENEAARSDRVDLVTVATPNSTHFDIAKAFIQEGFNVLCEKPLTNELDQARELAQLARSKPVKAAVNFGYTGYPMVRQMRAMIQDGALGAIRVVKTEFSGGFLADAADQDNPRVRWRFDPKLAGVSCAVADLGSHAMHLATFVTDQNLVSVSADFASGVKGRQLEDDAAVAFRMSKGAVGRMWVSGLAIGRTHGLGISVYGEKGGLAWFQECPEQLQWTPLNESTRILERGSNCLSDAAARANRLTVGHPEGMVLAFANLYRDLSDLIAADLAGIDPDPLCSEIPGFDDGLHMVEMVHASAVSASNEGRWVKLAEI